MDWTQPIDAYCERLGPGFSAEPFNAVSNIGFIIAAATGLMLWRKRSHRCHGNDRSIERTGLWLALLVGVIGVGSALFHTFANRWSSLADVIPIAIFIHVYFCLALYRLVGLPGWIALAATALFFGASFLADPFLTRIVGSSSGYVPALLAMLGIGAALLVRAKPGGGMILTAAATFAVSLGFRIADMPLCADWPLGLHFLWHVLNAVTLGLLLVAALPAPGGRARAPAAQGQGSRDRSRQKAR